MPIRLYGTTLVKTDGEGFLVDSSQWVPEVAEGIARDLGLGNLTEKHWRVISCCREEAARFGHPPDFSRVAMIAGLAEEELDELFHPSAELLAARIAGLSSPSASNEDTHRSATRPGSKSSAHRGDMK